MLGFGLFGIGDIETVSVGITAISPAAIYDGELVSVYGFGFGPAPGSISVGGIEQTPITWEPSIITFSADVATLDPDTAYVIEIENDLGLTASTEVLVSIFSDCQFDISPAEVVATGYPVTVQRKSSTVWIPVPESSGSWVEL